MEDKPFVWTSELNKKLFQLRFQNDWLFKSKKQPWAEFHKLLLENGFPSEMTVDHVRKKWSYTYDMYKIAKKTNNKSWKHFKVFDKHFGKKEILDKYESWNDDWRLKLIICVTEAKEMKLDPLIMWRTVERAMRCQDLPLDCCVQDMKGLWHHIRTVFNRKHRMRIKKGSEQTEWPLYDAVLNYNQKFDPDNLASLDSQAPCTYRIRSSVRFSKHGKKNNDKNDDENENEFHWSKDITETFIQIRLQHDWLFRQKKWAWNEMLKIMIEEYGFPKTLTSRELGRKWAATFSEYQKAKATNNKTWVYHNLFELYLGESSNLSLNPLVDWREEWVFNLINARTDLEHTFKTFKDPLHGWREVEKSLRRIGIPLDHSLLDLEEIWVHLLKTFRWKTKFANKGILNEQWPYFEAMSRYSEIQEKNAIKKQKIQDIPKETDIKTNDYADITNETDITHDADITNDADDDIEDDMKLYDLKQKLELQLKPKFEVEEADRCRSCSILATCVDIFEQKDDEGFDVAYKLKLIAGVEVEKTDTLPSHMCMECLQELENAYKFRRKCQDVDKMFRCSPQQIKVEIIDKHDVNETQVDISKEDHDSHDDTADIEVTFDQESEPVEANEEVDDTPKVKKERVMRKKKKLRKLRYDYWKICEVCGKHTRNLVSHLDTHSTDKLYSCDVCDKKFKFKSGLIIHKAVHNPTPRKTCEVCGKTFHIMAQYRRHFVYHANERKYGCETCGKRFNTLDILRVHHRTHTDERPFTCQECGKSFRTAGCVSRHKRIVHRNVKKVQ
ncbi:hypothetical protein PYW07_005307 [Mythimna separata]|uniref:Uncharacterized protein n=1 Tax=Mythimna separata TaxID=271217 RepID=A0AAD7YFE2_MYTSE|nr:hypothetical protein PYW07_005307 [Mythimna separata]